MTKGMSGMLKRLRDNWIPILLTIMVVVSLILSGIVWVNPYRFEHRTGRELGSGTRPVTTQSMRDIYMPTSVIHTKTDGSQHELYGQPANLILTVGQQLSNWQLHQTRRVANNNQSAYLGYLRKSNSLLLSYPSAVPLNIFNDSFNQELDSRRLSRVNHIVIPLNDPRHIYLMSDKGFMVFRVDTKKHDFSQLKKAMQGGHSISADHKMVNNKPLVTYPHGLKLPVFAYQVNHANMDNVSQALMNKSKRSISTHTNGSVITYSDGGSRHLNYNQQLGVADYENYVGQESDYSYSQIFGRVYNRLSKSTIPLDSLRYDNYHKGRRSQVVTYRSYVENFPIYNENGYGEVQMQIGDEGVERCHFTPLSIQVPLPVNQRKVKLPSTAVVFNQLREAGKLKDVSAIRVGYLWSGGANEKTVTLTPSYFVHYHGNWVDYQTLVK